MKAFQPLALVAVFALAAVACSSEKKDNKPAAVAVAKLEVTNEQLLVNAVQNFDGKELDERLENITKLLELGANPNAENELGEPVLGDAVHFGDGKSDDMRVVRLLVDKGADVNAVGRTGRSPLTKAAEANKIEVVELFLAHGLELNTDNGMRAMVKAAFFGHRAMVQLFVAKGLKPNGKYESALLSMSMDETKATAALFGAFADIAREELLSMLGTNSRGTQENFLLLQLTKIDASCKAINSGGAIKNNMDDYFNRTEECSSMGRLGALAYMHCYGLLKSNSSALQMLQGNINNAAANARAVLQLTNVKFEQVQSSQELLGYDKAIRRSMTMYHDLLLPWTRVVSSRLGHHVHRNGELRKKAAECGNKAIQKGAGEIAASVAAINGNHAKQLQSFQQELASMETMRKHLSYQLPALGATEELKRREEEKKRKEEEERKKKAADAEKPRA